MCGVLIIILMSGSFEVKSATNINIFKNIFKIIAINLAIFIDTKDIRIFIKPNDTMTPNNGIAIILDIKNVRDNVLKVYSIMGINNICAEIVMDNPDITACIILFI